MPDEINVVWPQQGQVVQTESGMAYTIGNAINSGGYALVFNGKDAFNNPVAIKVFKPANRPFEEVQEQWEQETQLFLKLRHPNVVSIYDAFIWNNLFYIVLEKAWGSLYDWIIKNKQLNEKVVREIARQLLFALYFIHKENVVHRDITIYNILAFEGPASRGALYKVSDFGISKEFLNPWEPHVVTTHTAHPCFTPPELLLPEYGYTNEQSDLYHLGLVLFCALKGKFPIDVDLPIEQINKLILDGVPRVAAEKIRTPFGDFIAILLRRHNEHRFPSSLAAWNHLKSI